MQWKRLQRLKHRWRTDPDFSEFRTFVRQVDDAKKQKILETMACKFFDLAIVQVEKHNKRYVQTESLIRSVFGEKETVSLFAVVDKS